MFFKVIAWKVWVVRVVRVTFERVVRVTFERVF